MLLASNPKRIKKLGLFEENEYPLALDIFALDLVTNHISFPSVFIHYIKQRMLAIDQDVFSSFDELSFLAWYLEIGNFYLIRNEKGKVPDSIHLDDSFVRLFDDHYIYQKEPPVLMIEKEIVRMIEFLEFQKHKGFSDIVLTLLDIPHDVRNKLINHLHTIIEQTRVDKKTHDATYILEKEPNLGITILTKFGRKMLTETLVTHCVLKKYETKISKWIGLGRNVIDPFYIVNEFAFLEGKWKYDEKLEETLKKL